MTDAEFWAQVRRQLDEPQPPSPRDRVLRCLLKGQQRAEAVVRIIDGTGMDLRYLWNGALRASQLYRDDEQLQAAAEKMRDGLLAKGWLTLARWHGGVDVTGGGGGRAVRQ